MTVRRRQQALAVLIGITFLGALMPEGPVRAALLFPVQAVLGLALCYVVIRAALAILTRGYSEGRGRRW